jgi:hypothetical protein
VFDGRNFGFLDAPDQPDFIDFTAREVPSRRSWAASSRTAGAILDKVTLNVGLRYDALTLATGTTAWSASP